MRKILLLVALTCIVSGCGMFDTIGSWFGCDGSPDIVEQQALDQNTTNAETITGYNSDMLEKVDLGDDIEAEYAKLNETCVTLAKIIQTTPELFGSENLIKNYNNMKGVADQNAVLNKAVGTNPIVADSRKELCDQAVELAKTLATE